MANIGLIDIQKRVAEILKASPDFMFLFTYKLYNTPPCKNESLSDHYHGSVFACVEDLVIKLSTFTTAELAANFLASTFVAVCIDLAAARYAKTGQLYINHENAIEATGSTIGWDFYGINMALYNVAFGIAIGPVIKPNLDPNLSLASIDSEVTIEEKDIINLNKHPSQTVKFKDFSTRFLDILRDQLSDFEVA